MTSPVPPASFVITKAIELIYEILGRKMTPTLVESFGTKNVLTPSGADRIILAVLANDEFDKLTGSSVFSPASQVQTARQTVRANLASYSSCRPVDFFPRWGESH